MIRLIFIILVTVIPSHLSFSQWVRYGPDWQSVYCIERSGDLKFAGTRNGIYLTSDEGVIWRSSTNGLGKKIVTNLYSTGSNLFACTRKGLYRSSDTGSMWERTGFEDKVVTSVIASNNVLFASVYSEGVYRSTDNGISWNLCNSGLNSLNVLTLFFNQDRILAGTSAGIFSTTNGGNNWRYPDFGLSSAVYDLCVTGTYLFACGSGMHMSTDNGNRWTEMSAGLPSSQLYSVLSDSGFLYTGGTQGMYKSTNLGQNWTPAGLSQTHISSIHSGEQGIFAGTEFGVQYTMDNGANWRPLNYGIAPQRVSSVTYSTSGSVYAGTDVGVYKTSDNGLIWTNLTSESLEDTYVNDLESASNYFFALTTRGIYRSVLYGDVWSLIVNDSTINCLSSYGNRLFAGKTNGVYYSDSYGNGWAFPGLNFHNVRNLHSNPGSLIAGTIYNDSINGIYFSSDNGVVWRIANWQAQREITAVGTLNGKMFAGTNDGVYFSQDTGNTWTQLNNGLAPGFIPEVFFFKNNFSFAAGRNDSVSLSCVYLLSTNGTHWLNRSQGLTEDAVITSMAVTNAYLFAGSENNNLWRRSFTEITGLEDRSEDMRSFHLFQNFPNPFNPVTKIRFDLPVNSRVSLVLYDMLGREVLRIVSDEYKTAGTYEYELSGKSLPSGIYFYALTADGRQIDVKRMVLLK